MFGLFKERALRKQQANKLYEYAALTARKAVFYESLGVPDTIDGRFEMMSVHVGFLIVGLNKADQEKLAQKLFDVNFKITDKALREIGVGDLSVPKHMKRMMKGFKGRVQSYANAIDDKQDKALEEAICRNIYGTLKDEEIEPAHIMAMAYYIKQISETMRGKDVHGLLGYNFPEVLTKMTKDKKSA